MDWIRERVWQMGIAAAAILVGAALVYVSAAPEPANRAVMWAGLGLIFAGFLVPLLIRLFEGIQEESGEEGEN